MVRTITPGREHLITMLKTLAREARTERGDSWESITLPGFLEAMAAWLGSYEHAYIDTGRSVPDDPWEVMASAVRAATIYE
jgi:hypothetical protein